MSGRRLPLWAKVVLWAALAVVVVVAAGVLWVWAALSGGIEHIFHSEPNPLADDVSAAREDAGARVETRADEVAAAVASRVTGGEVVATGFRDDCTVGQHNWKINDSFDLRCELQHTEVVVFDARAVVGNAAAADALDANAFRVQAMAVESALAADGWRPQSGSIADVMTEYWDHYARSALGRGDSPYGPDDLPFTTYLRGSDERLEVEWLDRTADRPEQALRSLPGGKLLAEEPVNPDDVLPELTGGRAAVVLHLTTVYWHD